MYVAITRAKKELILSHAKSRFVFGDFQMQMPSRFLKELPLEDIAAEEVFSGADFSYVRRSDSFGSQPKSSYSGGFGSPKTANSGFYSGGGYLASQQMKKPVSPAAKMEDGISGKRVFHQKFGYGKVVSADGNKLEIAFEKTGNKTVMKDFVSFA
jgi:DNA helicase II / ATP-dependent DNA helicase PcrA